MVLRSDVRLPGRLDEREIEGDERGNSDAAELIEAGPILGSGWIYQFCENRLDILSGVTKAEEEEEEGCSKGRLGLELTPFFTKFFCTTTALAAAVGMSEIGIKTGSCGEFDRIADRS